MANQPLHGYSRCKGVFRLQPSGRLECDTCRAFYKEPSKQLLYAALDERKMGAYLRKLTAEGMRFLGPKKVRHGLGN